MDEQQQVLAGLELLFARPCAGTALQQLDIESILFAGAALVVVLVRRRPAQAIPRNDEPQEW